MKTALSRVQPALERLPNAEIRLAGPLETQLESVVRNWLIPLPKANPAILDMFRTRDQEPYRDLLPWSGEFAGKYLTTASSVLRLTGDPKLKSTLQDFVPQLLRCQDSDGYLGPFPKANRLTGTAPNASAPGHATWDAWGHYHSIVGLLAWYDESHDPNALAAARKIGDLLCRFFKDRTVLSTGSPERNQAIVHALTLLYQKTGEKRYLDEAEKIVNEFSADGGGNYLEGALAGEEFFQLPAEGPRWESLHPIMGLAELYWATGKTDYRDAFERLYWSIAKTDRHNNGGFSSRERAVGDPYNPGVIETCCTIAWTAMGVEMLRLTADPKVADELELSTLNQIVALHSSDGAWCTYNTPMDGTRVPSTEDIAFQIRPGSEELNCCSVNAARGFGMIAEWALMSRGKGLALNWYGPSTLKATVGNTPVVLHQETTYPQSGLITLHVDPAKATKFPLSLRIPHWSAKSKVQVNGHPIPAVPGTYAVIDRTWKPGDRVTIALDMSPRFWVGQRECRGKTSVYRGPLLYGLDLPGAFPSFYGPWGEARGMRFTQTVGAHVDFHFEGDSIRWVSQRFDDAGIAEFIIDGKPVEQVDLYCPVHGESWSWERTALGPGPHTLRIVATGKKRPASANTWINVGKLEPTATPPTFSAADFRKAKFTPAKDTFGTWTVHDQAGTPHLLKDYAHLGQSRTPYLTWLPIQKIPVSDIKTPNPLPFVPTREGPPRDALWRAPGGRAGVGESGN